MNDERHTEGTALGDNDRENQALNHQEFMAELKQQTALLERLAVGVESQAQQLRAIKDQLIRINF